MAKNKKNVSITNENVEKFNSFINSTIFFSAKEFFRKESKLEKKELSVLDDEKFDNYLELCLQYEEKFDNTQYPNNFIEFINVCENYELHTALKSLTAIEQEVIFLLFSEELSQEDASKILKICSKSVSRIKIRAFNKLKRFFKERE